MEKKQYLCSRFLKRTHIIGTLPERLGIGLQNRGRRFESARYLKKEPLKRVALSCWTPVGLMDALLMDNGYWALVGLMDGVPPNGYWNERDRRNNQSGV